MYVCIVGMHVYLLIVIYRCPPSIPCCLFMFTSWVLKCPSRLSELRAWVSLACPWTPAQDILMMPAPAWIFDTYCMQYICFIARMCVEKRLPPQKYTCCSENFNLHSQRRDSGTNTPATLKHAASAQQVPDRTQSLTDISIHVLQECRLREWQALQAKTWVGNSFATHVKLWFLTINFRQEPPFKVVPTNAQ